MISLLARKSLDTFYRVRVLCAMAELAMKEGRLRGPGIPELSQHLHEADAAARAAIETIQKEK